MKKIRDFAIFITINKTYHNIYMKAAIVLAGCGVKDGAEIHEAVMTMYAIDKLGGTYYLFAPNVAQHHVINHITGEEMKESRNVLTEAARIARAKSAHSPTTGPKIMTL